MDIIFATLESLMQEMKINKNRTTALPPHASRNPLYVPPFHRTLPKISQMRFSVHTNDQTLTSNSRQPPSISFALRLLQHATIKLEFPTDLGDHTIIEWLGQVEQLFKYHRALENK